MIGIKPQLAKAVKRDGLLKMLKQNEYLIMEEKLDGHRMIASSDWAQSRGLKRIDGLDHILNDLPKGYVFDGEIVPKDRNAFTSADVTHLRAESPQSLEYVIFDLIEAQEESTIRLTQERRLSILKALEPKLGKNCKISAVQRLYLKDFEQVFQLYLDSLEPWAEGVMLKKPSAPYKENSRSAWLKYKFVDTVDVVITDCDSKPTEWRVRPGCVGTDGVLYKDGRHSDPWLAGHVGLSYGYYDPVIDSFKRVGSLGYTGPREHLEQFVGKVAEVKSYGLYETGAIRHPVFLRWREESDKRAIDCTNPYVA